MKTNAYMRPVYRHFDPKTAAGQELPTIEISKSLDSAIEQRYDAINQKLQVVEGFFKRLKPPHWVWHEYNSSTHPDGNYTAWEVIGMAKWGDNWRLCYGRGDDAHGPEVMDIVVLTDAPANVRIRAIPELEKLRDAILKAKEAYLPKVDKALKDLESFCEEIR